MAATLEQLQVWMAVTSENEHLEFKEAKNHFDFELLVKYCAALANEGGGTILLGITDKRPRRIVGSQAFLDLERTKSGLVERLRMRIDATVIAHLDGRVLVFQIPPRPIGMPIAYKGAYWMRAGEDLVPMTPDLLKRIFDESGPDFSAEVCSRATLDDLDSQGVEIFRGLWIRKSGNTALAHLDHAQLLTDAELLVDGQVTYAALSLMGSRTALGKYLAQAEFIYEYRSTEASISYQQREERREGFLLTFDRLWDLIDLRNEEQQYQDRFFVGSIKAFNETVVREAILNAASHRDYRLGGSTFIRQYPRKLEIVSPGGFPTGVTAENILWRQSPRNRRIAEAFARCGLVERSGQGANRMFEESIKESKRRPDFTDTDQHQVALTLWGEVQDSRFLAFLSNIGRETLDSFNTHDLLVLDFVHREQAVPSELRDRFANLRDRGVIESYGRGKNIRYILSRRFYSFVGEKGAYTRKIGLDKETNKALLLRHIQENGKDGSHISELVQVLPAENLRTIQRLLKELREEERIYSIGVARALRWYSTDAPKIPSASDTTL